MIERMRWRKRNREKGSERDDRKSEMEKERKKERMLAETSVITVVVLRLSTKSNKTTAINPLSK